MSRHSKRISVFDRLGPDNDRESSSHHGPAPPPPPPPVRHRHYSEKLVPEDNRLPRDKRDLPRKRRHGYDDDLVPGSSMEPRSNKRDKSSLSGSRRSDPRERSYSEKARRIRSSTSHSSTEGGADSGEDDKRRSSGHSSTMKRSKSQRERRGSRDRGSVDEKMCEPERKDSEYSHGDDERSRRKRDRESASDGEDHRETKRRKTEEGSKRGTDRNTTKPKDKRERKSDDAVPSVRKPSSRKRSLYDSLSESELESQGTSEIDWFSLAKIPPPKLKEKKLSALDAYKAGAILSKIGISASLAGPELTKQVESVVSEHLVNKYGCSAVLVDDCTGDHQLGVVSLSTHVEEEVDNNKLISNIGSCRKALVASVDFNIRKKLRSIKKVDETLSSDLLPSSVPPSTWDPELYSSSVSLYQMEVQ